MAYLTVFVGLVLIFVIIQTIEGATSEGETYGFGVFCGCIIGALFVFEIMLICKSISEPSPTAMEVYQGKTTLEYRIRDGIKVDSVVVWKDK